MEEETLDKEAQERFGTLLTLGALTIAGALALTALKSFGTEESETSSDTGSTTPPTNKNPLQLDLDTPGQAGSGLASLGREILAKKYADESLSDFLRQTYLGLFLIGRGGEQLNQDEVKPVAAAIQQFHSHLDRDDDLMIVEWLETMGVSKKHPLFLLLRKCPEIADLGVSTKYIAYALGERVKIDAALDFSDVDSLRQRKFI